MKYVYLCGPITGLTGSEANEWRQDPELLQAIEDAGWVGLSPFDGIDGYSPQVYGDDQALDAWFEDENIGEDAARMAVHKDTHYIDRSAAVIANLKHSKVPSIGSICELSYAYATKTPVIVVGPDKNHDHPFIHEFAWWVANHMDEAVGLLPTLGIMIERGVVPYA